MPDERDKLEKVSPAGTSLVPRGNYPEDLSPEFNPYGPDYARNEKLSRLREWWQLVYRHKWLIVAIVLVVVPFVAVGAYREKSIYQANTLIEIRKEGSSLIKTGDAFVFDTYDNTKAETIIVKSRPVVESVIIKLKLAQNPAFLDVTKKRTAWEALSILRGLDQTQKQKSKPEADQETAEEDSAVVLKPSGEELLTPAERVRLAPFINVVTENLKVEGIRETRLVKISFTHTDPEMAARVANGVAQSYIKYNFQTKTQRFTDTSDWLEESTRKLKAQVEQADQKLANYSREHNIFSLEGKENLTADKLVRLHDQAMRAETDLLLKQSLYEEVKQGRVAQLPEAFADPKTAELRKAHNELYVLGEQLGVKFGAKHPRLVEIRQQMAAIQEQINANKTNLEEKLRADYERAVRDQQSLKSALNQAKAEAVQQNQATIQYSVLQQDLTTAKALYTDFLNRTNQVSIQRAEQYNNVRLIESAETPGGPVGPNRFRTILIGLLFSLIGGIGLAYLIETLNTTIRSTDDVNRTTQLPVLAVIPTLGKNSPASLKGSARELTAGDKLPIGGVAIEHALDLPAKTIPLALLKDFSNAAEAYRMLRTSLLLSTAGQPPKTILVTSGQPGDGKTTTVFNAAIALTQLKSRVLIMDCDMRRPRIHKMAGLEKGKGLSTFLSSDTKIEELITKTSIPYLSILQCGPVPPNPSELISSERMKELLLLLADRYDYILIDSPPVVTVTDPLILSTLVDGVILVVKSGNSKSVILRRACHELAGVGAKLLGVVLNDFNLRREGYDYYYYYRYYSDYTDQSKGNGSGD